MGLGPEKRREYVITCRPLLDLSLFLFVFCLLYICSVIPQAENDEVHTTTNTHFSFGKYSIFLYSLLFPGGLNRPSFYLIFHEGCTLN